MILRITTHNQYIRVSAYNECETKRLGFSQLESLVPALEAMLGAKTGRIGFSVVSTHISHRDAGDAMKACGGAPNAGGWIFTLDTEETE
jgi:hypothetical protein